MFSVILACDKNGGIGKDNKLPWRLKGDMKFFSDTTKQNDSGARNVVIMGRKTYESIPKKFRPLPDRINVVITRNKNYTAEEGVFVVNSLDQALELPFHGLSSNPASKFFVIGGAEIYKQSFEHPRFTTAFITHVNDKFDCDTFVDLNFLDKFTARGGLINEENGVTYTITEYTK